MVQSLYHRSKTKEPTRKEFVSVNLMNHLVVFKNLDRRLLQEILLDMQNFWIYSYSRSDVSALTT